MPDAETPHAAPIPSPEEKQERAKAISTFKQQLDDLKREMTAQQADARSPEAQRKLDERLHSTLTTLLALAAKYRTPAERGQFVTGLAQELGREPLHIHNLLNAPQAQLKEELIKLAEEVRPNYPAANLSTAEGIKATIDQFLSNPDLHERIKPLAEKLGLSKPESLESAKNVLRDTLLAIVAAVCEQLAGGAILGVTIPKAAEIAADLRWSNIFHQSLRSEQDSAKRAQMQAKEQELKKEWMGNYHRWLKDKNGAIARGAVFDHLDPPVLGEAYPPTVQSALPQAPTEKVEPFKDVSREVELSDKSMLKLTHSEKQTLIEKGDAKRTVQITNLTVKELALVRREAGKPPTELELRLSDNRSTHLAIDKLDEAMKAVEATRTIDVNGLRIDLVKA